MAELYYRQNLADPALLKNYRFGSKVVLFRK